MVTRSPALREELFQLELEQIQRIARMRNGVVWAFIFMSFARGAYEILVRDGMDGLLEGTLRGVVPAALLALLGFPLVAHFTRKAEAALRGRFAEQSRRGP
jgi:hypothetical protein